MNRLFLASVLALASSTLAHAQQYPSPTFNNVTVNGMLNGKSIPSGAFVGTTDIQTLTNKTLTSPVLNNPTITGATVSNPTITGGATFNGSSSGATVLQPTAVASGTLTLPAATDTLTGKATTDTLTNKTYDTAGTGNVFRINGTQITAVTGTGSAVLATSPTLVTPSLGTPSALTLTNATGLPIASGVSGLGTGVATFLATPSSANLAAALTNETGSGAAVFATSPTLVTPVLGAATGTSLNLSGLTASSAVATDGSKNLVSVTNTGTGNNVLATSPTITTPNTVGVTNGSDATAGSVGEVISSFVVVGSAVSLTSSVSANVTSVSLTAGDWDCNGNVQTSVGGSTITTNFGVALSLVSTTFPTVPSASGYPKFSNGATTLAGVSEAASTGTLRVSVNGSTTVYLLVSSAFSGGTNSAYGAMYCRRMR